MCGIYFVKFKNKGKNIDLIQKNLDYILEKLKYRGPDCTNIVYPDLNTIMVHTLLAINGFQKQPLNDKNRYLMFNGEIYGLSKFNGNENDCESFKNIPDSYKGDSDFLLDFLNNDGLNRLSELDGEYVINYFDMNNNILHIITDQFGTKPFSIALTSEFIIASSYESCIKRTLNTINKTAKIIHVIPNNQYIIDLNTFKLKSHREILKWDFIPKYNNFERWNKAFENSVKKRHNTNKKIFVPLSSGYDSGAIVCALLNLKKEFVAYTFKGMEDPDILKLRADLINNTNNINIKHVYIDTKEDIYNKYSEYVDRIENYTAYHYDGTPYSDIYSAYSCFGIYQIFQKARTDKRIIFLSGHGGDEITSDYGNKNNSSASILLLDYKDVRSKWPNFDSSYGRNIIQMFERVSGCFGIESRYPFLDKHVVQEFLWLSDELKNSSFKQCIANYMNINNYPYKSNTKCSVRVLDGGDDSMFHKMVKKIKNNKNIKSIKYPLPKQINRKKYRPRNSYKPEIKYYP